jgi:hypothetical protein
MDSSADTFYRGDNSRQTGLRHGIVTGHLDTCNASPVVNMRTSVARPALTRRRTETSERRRDALARISSLFCRKELTTTAPVANTYYGWRTLLRHVFLSELVGGIS